MHFLFFLDVQIGLDMGKLIQQSRAKAKLTQKDLAAVRTSVHMQMQNTL